jgi:hypothetical protein
VLGQLGLEESIAAGYWYIWWHRREVVNGKPVATPACSACAINALTANFATSNPTAIRNDIAYSLRPDV